MASAAATTAPTVAARLGEQLQRIVEKRIEDDTLVLPTLPVVVTQCMEALNHPNVSIREIATLIEKDPIIAAQLVKLANSAAMGTREPMKTALDAVSRVGLTKVRTFLIEISARRLFESKDSRVASASKKIWEHSLVVGSVAADIAALANAKDAEFAYLAGLLHDIGKPVAAAMLLEAERNVRLTRPDAVWIGSADWLTVIRTIHRPIGVRLATKWNVPDVVLSAVRDCDDYDSGERQCAANAVRLANAVAKEQGVYEGEVNKDDVEAMVMIGQSVLGVDIEGCRRLVTSARDAMKALF
jgi:putative nucleotidyltransferase with HDIG domain